MNPASRESVGVPPCSAVVSSPGKVRVHVQRIGTLRPCPTLPGAQLPHSCAGEVPVGSGSVLSSYVPGDGVEE